VTRSRRLVDRPVQILLGALTGLAWMTVWFLIAVTVGAAIFAAAGTVVYAVLVWVGVPPQAAYPPSVLAGLVAAGLVLVGGLSRLVT
jgi:hypothetical protein